MKCTFKSPCFTRWFGSSKGLLFKHRLCSFEDIETNRINLKLRLVGFTGKNYPYLDKLRWSIFMSSSWKLPQGCKTLFQFLAQDYEIWE